MVFFIDGNEEHVAHDIKISLGSSGNNYSAVTHEKGRPFLFSPGGQVAIGFNPGQELAGEIALFSKLVLIEDGRINPIDKIAGGSRDDSGLFKGNGRRM